MSDPTPFRWAPFGPSVSEPPVSRPSAAPGPSPAPGPPAAPAPAAPPPPSRIPARRVAVVTCMDVRIDPLAVLGLRLGDAHVIRNAGAVVSEDVIRSLRLSHELTGTQTVILVGHSDCAAFGTDSEARAELAQGARRVAAALAPDGALSVVARWYDVASGSVEPV